MNGKIVAARKGGLIAKFTRRPWPDPAAVIEDVRRALEPESGPPA